MKSTSKEILEYEHKIPADSDSHTTPDGRVLHVYAENWLHRKARVLDSDKSTQLYTIEYRCRKPNMRIFSHSASSDHRQIAEISFHLMSSRIDTTIRDQDISLKSAGCTKQAYSYSSPAFGHRTLSWKARSKWGNPLNMMLIEENTNMPIARFVPTCWAKKKAGKLELLGDATDSGEMLDEVVITGLAVAQLRSQQMAATYGASAASAGAASSVAAAVA